MQDVTLCSLTVVLTLIQAHVSDVYLSNSNLFCLFLFFHFLIVEASLVYNRWTIFEVFGSLPYVVGFLRCSSELYSEVWCSEHAWVFGLGFRFVELGFFKDQLFHMLNIINISFVLELFGVVFKPFALFLVLFNEICPRVFFNFLAEIKFV